MSLEDIKADIKAVVAEKNCGPIFIRLSWHDAGVYSTGKLTGGEFTEDIRYCYYYYLVCWLIKQDAYPQGILWRWLPASNSQLALHIGGCCAEDR